MATAAVIGTGYVGLVTATCLAAMEHTIRGVDVRQELVEALGRGEIAIREPGLEALVRRGLASDRLRFTTSHAEALAGAEIAFVCVDTPPTESGAADVGRLRAAAASIAAALGDQSLTVVLKSTVPVGSARELATFFDAECGPGRVTVISNPEFLQQGHAVDDFMHPRRIVIGTGDGRLSALLTVLFAPFEAPLVTVNWETAEISKYASNAFLAAKVSFINEIAAICDATGADVTRVADAMGMDPRIGRDFLNAGVGFGGSCLPKDVAALVHTARAGGVEPELLAAVNRVNERQRRRVVDRLSALLGGLEGKHVALFGLSFKPGTADVRGAPSIEAIALLAAGGASIAAFDPVWREINAPPAGPRYLDDPYEAAAGADAVLVLTEWPAFAELSWQRIAAAMRGDVVLDARNMLRDAQLVATGLRRFGIGIPVSENREILA